LYDEKKDGNQHDDDVLPILSCIFVPMECLIEEGDEPQQQTHTTRPHAKISAPNPRANDTDNNQYQC
jgi:hypothetical protein